MKIESVSYYDKADGSCSFEITIVDKPLMFIGFNQPINKNIIGDCLLLLILFQSMEEKSAIEIPKEYPVSKLLLSNAIKLQDVFSRWYPKLSVVAIEATSKDPEPSNDKVSSFFSGGADSFYTFLKNKNEISDLLLCIGLDIQLWEEEKIKEAKLFYQTLAKNYDKNLLIVTTNIRQIFPKFDYLVQTGAVLSGLTLMFAGQRILVPATFNINELIPLGTHPLTDQYFSNGTTRVEHHDAINRSEKMTYLAKFPDALDSVRVCNSSSEFNCGTCEKCLRTMFALGILGVTSKSMPSIFDSIPLLKKLNVYKEVNYIEWRDNMNFSLQYNCPELQKQAKRIVRNYEIRLWLKEAKRLLFKRG